MIGNNFSRMGIIILVFLVCHVSVVGQNPVYVDLGGVMRWTKDKREASFFGVNYTVPFAYGYRSVKALGKDLKQAIDEDVSHFKRLGLDAFRVHMWDVEISDSLGTLLKNEHLDLFDYLLFKLKENGIYTLITPIAFWGNGYPERDEKTPGFATVYGKGPSVVKEEAIKAQEIFLRQLFTHVNPYTKTTYANDWHIIAAEINNEPHHSGPKEKTTEYVNRLAASIRGTGWTKPVFYNISESPTYSDAIAKANVEGHSFQWYPSGLVANREQRGNFLPHVDRYTIPFDSVPAYRNKARMVYEFDAADILESYMYPAMARSYRTAGFQWATQFAYDPLATAYGNTEYQTHYLNLAYTPSKAISLLIASRVFHTVPRLKSYGSYPADTLFDVFRVSYRNSLSEMNSEEEFYYSNSTSTVPKNTQKLRHIAGVGNSPVVQYSGTGAYFLDRSGDNTWRLEVMPDVVQLRDPFERASPKKEVTRLEWNENHISIALGGWSHSALVKPGVYFIAKDGSIAGTSEGNGLLSSRPFSTEASIGHTPLTEVSAGKPFLISISAAGLDTLDKITVELRGTPRWRTIPFKKSNTGHYTAEVPAEAVAPGVLNYRILVQRPGNDYIVYPGHQKGNPFAWDNFNTDTYQTLVASDKSSLEIFNTNFDRTQLVMYNPDWRNNSIRFVPSDKTTQLSVQVLAKTLTEKQVLGWQFYFGEKLKGRQTELGDFKFLVIEARSENAAKTKITLITKDAFSFSTNLEVGKEWKEIRISLTSLQLDSMLLLPMPFPGFLPLWFKAAGKSVFNMVDAEKIQVVCFGEGKAADLEVTSLWLEK